MTLAQAAAEPNLFGWYLGLGIGIGVVGVVALLVGWILYLAMKIGWLAPQINEPLMQAEKNTKALGGLNKTIEHVTIIIGGLQRGRARLGG